MGRKKQNDAPSAPSAPSAPVAPVAAPPPDMTPVAPVAVGATPAPDPYLEGILARGQDAPISGAPPCCSHDGHCDRHPAGPTVASALLVGATAVAEAMDNASASAPTRLDAAEALLEYTDRLPPQCADYAQRALDFLLRVVDRKRPDAINAEPRDRVRAAKLVLKYGQG